MTTKIVVSLPDDLVEQAKQAVRAGTASSVSAYVASALAEKSERDGLTVVLAELDRELGPPTPDDREWARLSLGLDPR